MRRCAIAWRGARCTRRARTPRAGAPPGRALGRVVGARGSSPSWASCSKSRGSGRCACARRPARRSHELARLATALAALRYRCVGPGLGLTDVGDECAIGDLRRLPFDSLLIDRAMIERIAHESTGGDLLRGGPTNDQPPAQAQGPRRVADPHRHRRAARQRRRAAVAHDRGAGSLGLAPGSLGLAPGSLGLASIITAAPGSLGLASIITAAPGSLGSASIVTAAPSSAWRSSPRRRARRRSSPRCRSGPLGLPALVTAAPSSAGSASIITAAAGSASIITAAPGSLGLASIIIAAPGSLGSASIVTAAPGRRQSSSRRRARWNWCDYSSAAPSTCR